MQKCVRQFSRWGLLLLGLAVVTWSGCGEAPDPLVTGEYLQTLDRRFEAVREKGEILSLTYSVDVGPAKPLTKPLYLESHFENPADPAAPLIGNAVLAPGMKKLNVYSPRLMRLEKGKVYRVDIYLFDSADKEHRLGTHSQKVVAQESYRAR